MTVTVPVWLNVGCGPWRADPPWVNLDVHRGNGVDPDVLVADPARPCATWADGTVDRIYLGHVLEHVPPDELPAFLADLRRALRPGGQIAVVGPDILRAIERWHLGLEPWSLVMATLEGPDYYPADGHFEIDENPDAAWRQARHWWNCTEPRVIRILAENGFVDVARRDLTDDDLGEWPVVDYAPWQMAVTARTATTVDGPTVS